MSFNFTVEVYSLAGEKNNSIILDKLKGCFCVDGEASFDVGKVTAKGYGGNIIDICNELAKLKIDCDVEYETDYGEYQFFTINNGLVEKCKCK